MKKIIFIFYFFLINISLNASYLYDSQNLCIDDYYVTNSSFNYLPSGSTSWISVSSFNNAGALHDGYVYDSTLNKCSLDPKLYGLSSSNFNALMALSGLIFGFLIFNIISNFLISM